MSGTPKKHRFLVSPYLFWMTSIGYPCLYAYIISTVVMLYNYIPTGNITERDFWFIAAFFIACLLFFIGIYIYESRLWTGWYEITGERITLRALFRRPLTLRYEDVQHVGVGKNRLSDSYAFWLYLSCDPVPLAQLNDMRKFKLTNRSLRIAYSQRAYDALCDCLPQPLCRQLQRAQATFRAHGIKQ